MKQNRKGIALMLALALVLTLIPASAFATTDNKVASVPTVEAEEVMPITTMTFTASDADGIPAGEVQQIKLSLDNAVWAMEDPTKDDIVQAGALANATAAGIGVETNASGAALTVAGISVGDDYAEISIQSSVAIAKDEYIKLTLGLEAGEEAGEVKVNVEGLDSRISSGSYTVAVVAGGETVATVNGDPKKTGRSTAFEAAAIEVREASVNSVAGAQSIKLTLPKGVSWNQDMEDNEATYISGNMVGTGLNAVIGGTDDRDLTITFNAAGDAARREVLVITPCINVGKDAAKGDVAVAIRNVDGDINKESGLVVAVYGDEDVTVTTVDEEDLPTIYAGYEFDEDGDEYTVEVTLEEVLPNSLIDGKFVDFTFPEWVQLVSGAAIEVEGPGAVDDVVGTAEDDNSSWEWSVPANAANTTQKYTFTFPVTVEAGHSGDLELTVDGSRAGVIETSLVVAKIEQPITAEVKLADLRTGIQNQAGGEIVIKETAAGVVREGEDIVLTIDNLGFGGGMQFDEATIELVAGDMELGKAEVRGGNVVIEVDRTSIKTPAEIKISGVEITLDRTLPEGKYGVDIWGEAVIDNGFYNDGDFDGSAVSADYVNIITPADGNVYGEAKFVIGQNSYTVLVNGELQTRDMDVAPYVDQNDRTMVPMRYVANALGVSDNNIVWNQAAQTATFFKGDRVCVLKAGDANMTVNGAVVPMDTVAVVVNDRIYVPMRYVANALGADVAWDQETLTVTLNASTGLA